MVALECVEVDGVGEVRSQQLVTLGLQPLTVGGQLSQGLGAGGEAFVERGVDLLGQSRVGLLADGDLLVAVLDELLGDADRDGFAGAGFAAGGSS
ncbi:hypothetical protein [Ornithinimicrobium humiphilum]|uniref:hypothetical protein n=1 Tax=Ornithinimicrobium humiphilum TaxID=125288 RepID=UPI001EE3713D|nr:hypothetical protein [Ornithinimicrobium humiphilum]